jgi:hypothetical protein
VNGRAAETDRESHQGLDFHPPVPFALLLLLHFSTHDCEMNGYTIPAVEQDREQRRRLLRA